MIDFFVSNIYGEKLKLNLIFKNLMKKHPEYFLKDYNISAVFGSFENSIWNGGRVNDRSLNLSFQQMKKFINLANENELSVRYTFTNSFINERFLNDEISNKLMDIANNGMNGVIVNSPLLFNYLKSKYPNFHYVYSTTNCTLDAEGYNNNYDIYDILVLDWRVNKNIDFLNNLKKIDKIEILINNTCPIACKNVKNHYINTDIKNLYFDKFKIPPYPCLMKKTYRQLFEKYKQHFYADFSIFLECLKAKANPLFSREELNEYISKGFNKFKISGRSN